MKRLIAFFLMITLAFTMLCACGEDSTVNNAGNNGDSTGNSTGNSASDSTGDSVVDSTGDTVGSEDEVELPEVDPETGKVHVDEMIVPVELHTNSYLYTVLTYNEEGDIIGETTYNTRLDTEVTTTYEYVQNDDGTMLLCTYSDNSGYIHEYDTNGYCVKRTYYRVNSVNAKPKDVIFAAENMGSSVTYQYDSMGRVTSRTSYTSDGAAELITAYTYNDENLILSKITTYPSGEVYESLEFSLNEKGDYSQLHMVSLFYNSDTVTSFEWSYDVEDDLLCGKTMNDDHGKKIAFAYEYDDNGALERIMYYHGYEIMPVEYFLGEGALMDSTDLAADVVFMPLSKALAQQNQN